MEDLRNIFNNVNDWLKYAEAKNFGLLTLCAGIVAGITQMTLTSEAVLYTLLVYILSPVLIMAGLICFISLTPVVSVITIRDYKRHWVNKLIDRLSKTKETKDKPQVDLHFFGSLATITTDEFEEEYLEATKSKKQKEKGKKQKFNKLEKQLVGQILFNSRITSLKYNYFKVATYIILAGVTLSILTALVMKLIK
jgi:hypothetical protein